MATKYLQEYASEADFLADAVDAPGRVGVAAVSEILVINKAGSVVEVVDETATQTLTNKTLTAPVITTPTISETTLTVTGAEAGNATIALQADQGDDTADKWNIAALAASATLKVSNESLTGFVQVGSGSLNVTGEEAGDATLQLYADESDDAADRWTVTALAASTNLKIANASLTGYVQAGSGTLSVVGEEAGNAGLILDADEGDDNADTWTIQSTASDNDLDFINHTTTVASISSVGLGTFVGLTNTGAFTHSGVTNGPAPVAQGAGTALSVTAALHAGKTIYVTDTDGMTFTLEAATGTGNKYCIHFGATAAGDMIINVTGNDSMAGLAYIVDEDTAAVTAYRASGDADQMVVNGTTKGGQIGDRVYLQDVATDKWAVTAFLTCPAGSNPATPFATGQVS